jgi:hypothetical protein
MNDGQAYKRHDFVAFPEVLVMDKFTYFYKERLRRIMMKQLVRPTELNTTPAAVGRTRILLEDKPKERFFSKPSDRCTDYTYFYTLVWSPDISILCKQWLYILVRSTLAILSHSGECLNLQSAKRSKFPCPDLQINLLLPVQGGSVLLMISARILVLQKF